MPLAKAGCALCYGAQASSFQYCSVTWNTCTNAPTYACKTPEQQTSFLLGAGTNINLEESFVMLAGSASSLRHAPANGPTTGIPLQPLDVKFAQMARVFEIASEATKASIQASCKSHSLHTNICMTEQDGTWGLCTNIHVCTGWSS